jgi:hypothetical protein
VTLFLLFLWERADKLLVEYIALLEEQIFFCHLSFDVLRPALAISLGRQSVSSDTVLNQIVYHALSPSLR